MNARKSGEPDLRGPSAESRSAIHSCRAAIPGIARSPATRRGPVRRRNFFSRCQTAQSSSFPRRVYAPGFVCPVRPGLARGFGVEAAVTLAAIPAAAIPLHPERGVDGAPTGALFLLSRVRGATTLSRRVRPGRPLGAPPWRFSAGDRAAISGSGTPEPAATCPRRVIRPGRRYPGPPAARLRAAAAGRHSPLRLGIVSGDAPPERGCATPTTASRRSQ